MLALDDRKWKELLGGYKVPYDASHALRRLERGADAWKELWEELHHQGDLGEASYAAVPKLVRIVSKLRRRACACRCARLTGDHMGKIVITMG
jgi:hypothetical protein